MAYTYTINGEWTPQEEHAFLLDIESWKGLRSVTYNRFTNRLMAVEVDEFTVWRIELAKKLLEVD